MRYKKDFHSRMVYRKYDLKYFLWNCRYYIKYRLKRAKEKNVLYFVFDPKKPHSGLADRMKAIISLYNVAKRDGYKFKFYYDETCSLANYLSPNLDWRMKWDDLEYSLFDTKLINECNWRMIPTLKPNKQYHCYSYAGNEIPWQFEDTGYKWHELFNELFVPSERLLNAYNSLNFQDEEYVCVHLRFVNALERFENTFFENYLASEDERQQLINKCKTGIKDIINENAGKSVYVFSDSKVFLDSLNDLPVKTLNSEHIGHISFNLDSDVQLKTFLDLYVMSKSQAIYRIKAKEIYNLSCFALLASRMGDVKFIDKDLDAEF